MPHADPVESRRRLASARVLLVFTPELAGSADPLEALVAAAPWIDIVQVRPKALGGGGRAGDVTEARAAYDWCLRCVEALERAGHAELPVLVNDRVDVAAALASSGVVGVHLGHADTPVEVARDVLGPDAWIGFSTHSLDEVVRAAELPVDLLGFGPVFASRTKGYGVPGASPEAPAPLGAGAAWIAREAAHVPLFAIGGIDETNADELAEVGRIAVGAAILGASDPARAARALRESMGG